MSKEYSPLLSRLLDDEFVISAQIDPPGTSDINDLHQELTALRVAGINVVDINSSRRLSHDSLQLSTHIANIFGLDVIPHIALRDAPLHTLMKQILATYTMSNVRSFLVVSGDPYEITTPSQRTLQVNTANAIRTFDGHLRKSNLALNIEFAAAVNQNENDLDREGQRLEAKVAAKTDFFMSQPVFTQEQAEQTFCFYRQHTSKPLIMGIWPLVSVRTVENIRAGKVTGVTIPDHTYESAITFGSSESLREWSAIEAVKLIEYIRRNQLAQGVYLVAPLRKPSQLVNLVEMVCVSI